MVVIKKNGDSSLRLRLQNDQRRDFSDASSVVVEQGKNSEVLELAL